MRHTPELSSDAVRVASLLDPVTIGDLELPNRVIMAPMTRLRGTPDHLPTPIMRDYYAQHASAGLIISEGTPVSPRGVGYANVPGIWSKEQTLLWKPITAAVHNAGGRIFAQIWHVGRISHPMYLNGELPVAPSAIAAAGHVSRSQPPVPYPVPHALTLEEIPGIVDAFQRGAENAQAAGFDGVEMHGANGYLLDQFLQDGTNHRTDEYGGSLENRARLMLDVTDAVVSVWGPDRVGMHLAPHGKSHDIQDSNPHSTFGYVAQELGKRGIAFICVRDPLDDPDRFAPELKAAFGKSFIANDGFTRATGNKILATGEADAVAYARLFLANPDLPLRFANNESLNMPDKSTFYTHDATGYTDYPTFAG